MNSLTGKRVVITAGPTREAFDPIRFISNASTGAQGIELAAEAVKRGATVTLILGPTMLPPPGDVRVENVTTARQMYDAALRAAADADIVIGAAAVCDWRPAEFSEFKLKKNDNDLVVRLVRNPDILAELGRRKNYILIGFAAETNDHEKSARAKMRQKDLNAIVVNDVRGERGFGNAATTLTLLHGEIGRIPIGTGQKHELAKKLWDTIEQLCY